MGLVPRLSKAARRPGTVRSVGRPAWSSDIHPDFAVSYLDSIPLQRRYLLSQMLQVSGIDVGGKVVSAGAAVKLKMVPRTIYQRAPHQRAFQRVELMRADSRNCVDRSFVVRQ